MPSLSRTHSRFTTSFTIIEGGSGVFQGIITEPGQGEVPSFQFNLPRRLLRVSPDLALSTAMVVRDQAGAVYMLGKHGSAHMGDDQLFRNFRLFEASKQFPWQTRGRTIDPVTKLKRDTALTEPTMIWGAYEPGLERFDRGMQTSFELARFITNRVLNRDDLVDGRKVARVDEQLGLQIVALG
jgi:hypothetical protein